MSDRRIRFEHDGHEFEAMEAVSPPAGDGAAGEPVVSWLVRMDDAPALEFRGEYPYRDSDVHKRVVEWYEIQKPRR